VSPFLLRLGTRVLLILHGELKRGMTAGCTMDMAELAETLRRFYGNNTIRRRMGEFLGSAAYIAGTDGYSDHGAPLSPACLQELLDSGLEVDRSLWDEESLIADIDLEYHNFDDPTAPWLDPERAFRLQQPVLDATLRILGEHGIAPLTLVSGRGFHLVWAIRRASHAFRRLAELGSVPPTLEARYAAAIAPAGFGLDLELGRAFAGLGLIVEYVAHRALEASAPHCAIPVKPTAIEVGPGAHGREIVSFDLSEYGDPLHARHVRIPFSAYLKPRQFHWTLGDEGVRRLFPMFEIPLAGMTPTRAMSTPC